MKNLLETIWHSYQDAHPFEKNEERKLLLEQLLLYEDHLRASLTKEQWETLQRYDECICKRSAIDAKEAFTNGCQFAVQFLLEALYAK